MSVLDLDEIEREYERRERTFGASPYIAAVARRVPALVAEVRRLRLALEEAQRR